MAKMSFFIWLHPLRQKWATVSPIKEAPWMMADGATEPKFGLEQRPWTNKDVFPQHILSDI